MAESFRLCHFLLKNRLFDIYFPETVDFFGKSLSDLKECLHLPENVDEGETVELKIHYPTV